MKRSVGYVMVFVLGFGVCWVLLKPESFARSEERKKESLTIDTQKRIRLQRTKDGKGYDFIYLSPYAVNTGDQLNKLREPAEDTQTWSVFINDGQLVVFCEEENH